MKTMQVREAVSERRPPRCVAPQATLAEAWRAMREAEAHALVVTVDGTPEGTLVGIVTGKALLERGMRETDHGVVLDPLQTVGDVLVHTPQPASDDADVGRVLASMRELRVTALPLVRGGRLAGLVTETDVLRALEARLAESTGRMVEGVETGLATPLWANFMQLLSEAGI